MTYEPTANKTGRIDPQQPAVVLLEDNTVIDAAHQFTNDSGQLCVYLETRGRRVDARINLDNVTAVITSEDAAALFGIKDEFHGDTGELVADGGSVIDAESGDHIWLNGGFRSYLVQRVTAAHPEDPGNETDEVRIAVGRHTDSVDPAYIDLDRVERCGECGDLTDGTLCACDADDVDHNGIPVVTDALRGHGDDDQDDDTSELMTDGGFAIKAGDHVIHDDRKWTVAHTNTSHAELYSRNASPLVVALTDIEPIQNGDEES